MEVGRLDLEEGNTCWYCGGCRARSAAAVGTRNAESFRSKHGRSCGVEITRIVRHAVEATPVSGPPCSIEGLIEEVQAARRDETLITPGLDFVAEVLSTVQRMDTSQMSGNAQKDEEVERMYRRRCEVETGAERASKLTQLEAALAVTTGKKRISGRARSEIYKVLSDRGLIRPALLRRAAATAAELEMTAQFITVDMNHGEADKRQFGALQLSYRQLMPCLFKLLSHPALNLKEDLCTEVENIYDEFSDPTSKDPFRGGYFGTFPSALYFRAVKAVIPGLAVPVVVMIALDGTNVVGTGSRIINPLYALILNIAPQHRFKEYSMAVVNRGLLMLPTLHPALTFFQRARVFTGTLPRHSASLKLGSGIGYGRGRPGRPAALKPLARGQSTACQ